MINSKIFLDFLIENKINAFYGVPDSLLKELCKTLLNLPKEIHQITANEGNAIASAIGHHLATNEIGCVYLQNSGLGNTVNPLVSLASKEVYSIPILLLIGWRGELIDSNNQLKDEPQHKHQGRITLNQLKILNIPYEIISGDEVNWKIKTKELINLAKAEKRPVAVVCRKNTFSKIAEDNKKLINNYVQEDFDLELSREDTIKKVINAIPCNIPIFCTTGMASRELYELRKNNNLQPIDFYTVGGMGCASSIALGYIRSSKEFKQIICIDGDGSSLMHLGNLFKVAKQPGFIHIVINNNAHDSVGGQPTDAFEIDFKKIGKGLGFNYCSSIWKEEDIYKELSKAIDNKNGSNLVEIKVYKGNRSNLGRPKETPIQNKEIFMNIWGNK